MKNIVSIILIALVVFSCNTSKKESLIESSEVKNEEVAANYKSIEMDIEGMTCEIGCARTIQSKLSKIDGVTYSKVNFETKKGQFTFDENKVDKETLLNKIEGIGGGDLYKVTKTNYIAQNNKKID